LTLVERLADIPPELPDMPAAEREDKKVFRETTILNCVFVPLIGAEGYEA
jgi:predicted cobalt transporter CbtA